MLECSTGGAGMERTRSERGQRWGMGMRGEGVTGWMCAQRPAVLRSDYCRLDEYRMEVGYCDLGQVEVCVEAVEYMAWHARRHPSITHLSLFGE